MNGTHRPRRHAARGGRGRGGAACAARGRAWKTSRRRCSPRSASRRDARWTAIVALRPAARLRPRGGGGWWRSGCARSATSNDARARSSRWSSRSSTRSRTSGRCSTARWRSRRALARDFEIVVVDDGSRDGSPRVIEARRRAEPADPAAAPRREPRLRRRAARGPARGARRAGLLQRRRSPVRPRASSPALLAHTHDFDVVAGYRAAAARSLAAARAGGRLGRCSCARSSGCACATSTAPSRSSTAACSRRSRSPRSAPASTPRSWCARAWPASGSTRWP